jgi:hypothetical protein
MSLPWPIRLYNFHANLIWWDGPFNSVTATAESEKSDISNKLSGVVDNAMSKLGDTIDTAKPDSAVSFTPQSQLYKLFKALILHISRPVIAVGFASL